MKLANPRFLIIFSAFLGGLITAPAVFSEIYRWVDENGIVHYSEVPPSSNQQAEIRDLPATPEEIGEIPPAGIDFDGDGTGGAEAAAAAELKRQQLAESREQLQDEQEALTMACNRARSRLQQIEPNRRVYFTNEEGETERMNDDQRVAEVAQLHEFLDRNCP